MGGSIPAQRGRVAWRVAQVVLTLAIVVGIFAGIIPRIADFSVVWATIRTLSAGAVSLLLLLTAWNIITYWPVLVAGLPGLTLPQAAVVNQASTSVAMTLPGGGAIAVGMSYAMYTSWGFSPAEIALSALATGIANIFVKLLLPAVALLLLAYEGEASTGLLSTAMIGVGLVAAATLLLALMLRSELLARRIGSAIASVASRLRRLARRPPVGSWGDAAVRFRTRTITLLRDRWLFLASTSLVSQLSVYLVLLASLRLLGIPDYTVGWAEVLAVFAFVRLASAFPILPGNVGLAELGYIGGLVLAGGPHAQVVAAVLVFRFLTYYAQIPIGGLTYVMWRRNRSWRGLADRVSNTSGTGEEAAAAHGTNMQTIARGRAPSQSG